MVKRQATFGQFIKYIIRWRVLKSWGEIEKEGKAKNITEAKRRVESTIRKLSK